MAFQKQTVGIDLPVRPILDKGSVSKLLKNLKKQVGGVDAEFKSLARTSQQNIFQIRDLSKAADQFAKKLGTAAKSSFKQLKELGDQLQEAHSQAEKLESAYASAKSGAKKSEISGEMAKLKKTIADLNKQAGDYSKENVKYKRELQNLTKDQQKYHKALKDMASFTGKDALRGTGQGLLKALRGDLKGGLSDALQSAGKGVQGKVARIDEARAAKVGGAEGAAQAASAGEALGAAAAGIAAGALALAAFVKLLMAASNHMTTLNKALMDGNGFANEFGSSAQQWRKSVDDIRNSAIKSSFALMELGTDSEGAMKAVGAYTKEASGSIVRTEIQLSRMGGGDLTQGLFEFTKQATVYGKALGVETTEIAGLMGKMVSEVGINSENVQKTMGDIVKQASQAGMPVTKFMSIFQEAIPNMDLFTNRIEELTGMMKLLSKTMDPRAVKGFMQAMGRGFDQLDFKQRLKMALIVGPGEMKKIMSKDIGRATEAVVDQLKASGLDEEFRKAIAGPNAQKAVADLAAKAQALGVQGSTVGEMQKLARYKDLSRGGVLKQTTGMRDMGLFARMESLEKYAKSLDPKDDLTGLGEHVAKQLGVSEQEYKALVDMKMAMSSYKASAENYGRTASKSINDNLKKNFIRAGKLSEKANDADFELLMKQMAKQDPKGLEEEIKLAATEQIEQQQDDAKKDDKQAASMEDLTLAGVKATTSIGDQIENVIKYLLEKIYSVISDVLDLIGSIYDMLPSWISNNSKAEEEILQQWSQDAKKTLGENNKAGIKYYQETNRDIMKTAKVGSQQDLLNKFSPLLMEQLGSQSDEAGRRKALSSVMSADDVKKFIGAQGAGDSATTNAMLKDLSKGDTMKLLSILAQQKAGGMKDFQYGTTRTDVGLKTKKQLEEARVQGDIDARATQLAVAAGGTAVGDAALGVPSAKATAEQQKDHAEAAQQTAQTTQTMLEKQEEADKKANQDYQNTADVLSLLKKGIKFDQTWMNQRYKSVLKEASLDAFRPALAEYLLAYMRLTSNQQVRDKYLAGDPRTDALSLQDIGAAKNMEELDRAMANAANAPHAAAGGIATFTGLHALTAGERILPPGQSGSGGNVVNAGGITINVANGDPNTIKAKVYEALDEFARRH